MTDWNAQYNKLKDWVHSKGYEVKEIPKVEECIVFEDYTIYIDSNYKIENRLYTLLHECGHYLVDLAKDEFLETHPLYATEVSDGRVKRSIAYKVCILSEELKAWEEGWRLAKALNLEINKEKYHKCMVDALWSYVLYVV